MTILTTRARAWVQQRYPNLLRGETPLAINVLVLLAVNAMQGHSLLLTLGLVTGSLLAIGFMLGSQLETPRTRALTIAALVLLALLLLGVPKAQQIAQRHGGAPGRMTTVIAVPANGVTDSVVQQEEAGRALLRGHDPYGYDYTPVLGVNGGPYPGFNPATHHLAYLPGAVLLSAAGTSVLGQRYDGRLWFFPALVLIVVSTYLLGRTRSESIAYVALTLLNPLYLISWLWSSNDILFIAPLAFSLALLQRDKPLAASLSFAVALTFKSFVVLLVPFFVLVAIKRWGWSRASRGIALGLVTAAAIILPFFLWSPSAFVADTVTYLSAGGPDNYPITGYSLGSLLLRLGVVHDAWQPFPTWFFQFALTLPCLVYGLTRVWRRPDRANAFVWPGLCLLLLILTSRFAQHNYFVFPAALLLLATWSWISQRDHQPPAPVWSTPKPSVA